MSMSARAGMMVWRVTEAAPMGEWVDARTIPGDLPRDEARQEAGAWAQSSIDLMLGADVTEVRDTVPADLLDELFGPLPTGR
jgi:hypothetical protein